MNLEKLKKEQLKAAMELDDRGIEPDKIMVTYTPEEYAAVSQPKGYEASAHEVSESHLPGSIVGSYVHAGAVDLTKDAFARDFNGSPLEAYLSAVEEDMERLQDNPYEDALIRNQSHILTEFLPVVEGTLRMLRAEYQEYDSLINATKSFHTKFELEQDQRATWRIVSRVEAALKRLVALQNRILETLEPGKGTR